MSAQPAHPIPSHLLQSQHSTRIARRLRRVRIGLARLSAAVCSSTWLEDAWRDRLPYPPPADHTPMRPCQCPACAGRRYFPAHYLGPGDIAYECRLHQLPASELAALPPSSSVLDPIGLRRGWQQD